MYIFSAQLLSMTQDRQTSGCYIKQNNKYTSGNQHSTASIRTPLSRQALREELFEEFGIMLFCNVRVTLDSTNEIDSPRRLAIEFRKIDGIGCSCGTSLFFQLEDLGWKLEDLVSQSDIQANILEERDGIAGSGSFRR